MKDKQEESTKEVNRAEKRHAEEVESLAREQERKKAYLAREQAIETSGKAREPKRAERRATAESEQLVREQARKEAFLAREKAIAEAQEARKLKAKKQEP